MISALMPRAHLWIVGRPIAGGWMTEGIYWTEQQAIAHITNDSEFVARFVVGEPLPDSAIDADVMYWPRHETWETSKLFELRRGARAIAVDALNTARGL